jgi:hypothetical protein
MVEVAQDINRHLWNCDWLEHAPFTLVNLILRFGDARPDTEIGRIDTRHAELPVARELSMSECEQRARDGSLYDYFHNETISALKDVSQKYSLPLQWVDTLEREPNG